MNFLINNWYIIFIAAAALVVGAVFIYRFFKIPSKEQIQNIKEWLLYAVTEAEKELGSGTGEIKLRYVYDMFIATFPQLSRIISFSYFSFLVDEVLDNFRELLESNDNIHNYVDQK